MSALEIARKFEKEILKKLIIKMETKTAKDNGLRGCYKLKKANLVSRRNANVTTEGQGKDNSKPSKNGSIWKGKDEKEQVSGKT